MSQNEQERSSSPAQETKAVVISPVIGIALKENVVGGLIINYGRQKTEFGSTSFNDYKTIGGGVFIRRYHSVASKLYLFGQVDAVYNDNESDQTTSTSPLYRVATKGWNGGINLSPGLSYNVFKSLHLETSFNSLIGLSYSKNTQTETGGFGNPVVTENKGFSISSSVSNSNFLNVGVRFIIPKKKS